MAEHTSIATRFWEDPYVLTLPPTDKLLFLYLISGPQTEPTLGIYELSLRTMAHHTGLTEANIQDSLNRFAIEDKIHHIDGWVILKKHFKHNSLRGNQRLITGALRRYENVPWGIRERIQTEDDTLYIPYLCPTHNLYIGYDLSTDKDRTSLSQAKNVYPMDRVPIALQPRAEEPVPIPSLSHTHSLSPSQGRSDTVGGPGGDGKSHLGDQRRKLANRKAMP